MTLTSALRIAINGVNASQIGLSTISHNISNTNTDGYHRQSVLFSNTANNGLGAGVQLEGIQREADRYLESRLVTQTAVQGYQNIYLTSIRDIETQLGDPTSETGLDKLMNGLFTQVSALANYTDSSAQKRNVIQQAQLVVENIRTTYDALTTAQSRADQQIDEGVANVNQILRNIHDLNTEITAQVTGTTSGANANDLIDQRQREVEKLATYFSLQVTETDTGALRVITENGRQLVDVGTYSQLERTAGSPYGGVGIRRILVDNTPANNVLEINMDTLTTGSMKGLVDVRDTLIPNTIAELNELTSEFMGEFNAIHSRGTTYPPVNSLTSGNNRTITNAASDLYTELDATLAGDTFHISIVDSNGDTVATTVNTGLAITGTGPVALPGGGPFSINDLVTLINGNADVGVTALGPGLGVTASTGTDANGDPTLSLAATDPNLRVVIQNVDGDFAGIFGMNNFFTGTNAADLAIRSDISSSPDLIAFAQMRMSDGGVSSLDNRNAVALAQLSETDITFDAAGTMPAVSDSVTGYINQMLANFAIQVLDANDRKDFADAMLFEMQEQEAAITGVNIDEELTQMIIFQNAYQASARIISTVDELMEYLIQVVG